MTVDAMRLTDTEKRAEALVRVRAAERMLEAGEWDQAELLLEQALAFLWKAAA